KGHPYVSYGAIIEGVAKRHADQRKISRRAFAGLKISTPPVWCGGRQNYCNQDFVLGQDILALYVLLRASKELFERQCTFSVCASQDDVSPQHDQRRRQI